MQKIKFLILLIAIILTNTFVNTLLPETYTKQPDVQLVEKIINFGYSPDQKYLIVLSQAISGQFFLFDGRRGKNKQIIKIQDPSFNVSPQCFSFSNNNDILFIATKQGVVYGFDIQNNKINIPYSYRYQVRGPNQENWIRAIDISAQKLIAIGAQSKVLILSISQKQLVLKKQIILQNMDIYTLAWSPNPKDNLLIGGIGQIQGLLSIYSVSKDEYKIINNLKTKSIAYFPKGDYYLQGQLSSNITIYDSQSNLMIETINGTLNAGQIFVNFNGQRIGVEIDRKNVAVFKVVYNDSIESTYLPQGKSYFNLKSLIFKNDEKKINIVNTLNVNGQNLAFSQTGNQILIQVDNNSIVSRYNLCIDGKYYDKSTNQCGICQPNCLTCYGNAKVCQSCSPNNYLDGYQCVSCNIKYTGCLTCLQDGSKCLTCNQNEHWKQNATIQGKCICQQKYFQEQGKCSSCSIIPDCDICDSSTNCLKCKDQNNFQPLPKDGKCICKSGYTLKDGKCNFCNDLIIGCVTCNDQNTCTLCNQTLFFDPSPTKGKCVCKSTYFQKDRQCLRCDQAIYDCKTCSQDGKQCNECQSKNRTPNKDHSKCICVDFYYDENNICKPCDLYHKCLHCNSTQICLQCNKNQHWVKNKQSKCVCEQGYYQKDNKCLACIIPGCAICQTPQTCSQCSSDKGFIPLPVQNVCYCKTGFYPTPDKMNCMNCSKAILGCKQCNNGQQCLKCSKQQHFNPQPNKLNKQCDCITSYYKNLTTQTCSKCSSQIPHCLNCGIQKGKIICYQCDNEFELNDKKSQCIQKSSGLGVWTTILIIVGVLAAGGLILGLTKHYRNRRRQRRREDQYQPLERERMR